MAVWGTRIAGQEEVEVGMDRDSSPDDDLLAGGPPDNSSQDLTSTLGRDVNTVDNDIRYLRGQLASGGSETAWMRLGRALYLRYELLRDPGSLNEAIRLLDEGIKTRVDYSEDAVALSYLAACHVRRFDDVGDNASLRSAILLLEGALARSHSSELRWWICSNLAAAQTRYYDYAQDYANLNEAHLNFRQALSCVDNPLTEGKVRLHYGRCLVRSYRDYGNLSHLLDANEVLEIASKVATGSLRVLIIVELGSAKLMSYQSIGDLELLNDAIVCYDEALQAPVRQDYPRILTNLGNALKARYERSTKNEDLNRAVEALSLALDATPRSSKSVPFRTIAYANCLVDRYESSLGNHAEDLDAALNALRFAAAICPSGHPDRARLLNSLGETLLMCRSDRRLAASSRFDDIISTFEAAASGAPASIEERPRILANLANALLAVPDRPGARADASRYLSEALYMSRPSEPLFEKTLAQYNSLFGANMVASQRVAALTGFEKAVLALFPKDNESAADLSATALHLQRYLRSLDTDEVQMAQQREPLPGVEAKKEPEAGKVIILFYATPSRVSALLTLLESWLKTSGRQMKIIFEGDDEDLKIDLPRDQPLGSQLGGSGRDGRG